MVLNFYLTYGWDFNITHVMTHTHPYYDFNMDEALNSLPDAFWSLFDQKQFLRDYKPS